MKKKETTTSGNIAPSTGNSPGSALPVGATAKIPIIPGFGPGPRVGNLQVSLLEVVRGKEAATRIQSLGIPGEPPKTGFKYIIIQAKVEYFRSGKGPREQPYKLTEGQFLACSSGGRTEYPVFPLSRQDEEGLIGHTFSSGDSRQGWLYFQVPQEEKKPLLIFRRENVENVWGLWSDVWFQLF